MKNFNKANRTVTIAGWIITSIIILILFLGITAGIITNKTFKKKNKAYSKSSENNNISFINLAKLENTIIQKQNKKFHPETKIDIPDHKGYLISVYKEKHLLKLYKDNKNIKVYPVNLRSELADRRIWRDNQTPEGIFYIEDINIVTNGWSRWMRLNTLDKAKKIYIESYDNGEKNINSFETKYGEIKTDQDIRQFNNKYPNQKMLRGIGIHGGGYSPGNDWTIGCIALNDEDVIELYDLLINSNNQGIGIPVIIQD